MNTLSRVLRAVISAGIAFATRELIAAEASPPPAAPPGQTNSPGAAPPRTDARGNSLRRAPTGHVSNYDESKVGTYTLPDPLLLQNGQPVRDADTWFKKRRPELLKLYETYIYGRVPERAPKPTFEVVETVTNALDGAAVRKRIVGHFGQTPDAPTVTLVVYRPAKPSHPVPLFLHLPSF